MKKWLVIGLCTMLVSVALSGCFPLPKQKKQEEVSQQQVTQDAGQRNNQQTNQSSSGYVQGNEGLTTPETTDDFATEDYSEPEDSDGGVWPWTSYQKVSKGDLSSLSDWDLDIMRNEIYARHGYVFNRSDLRNYFESQAWYYPAGIYENREQVNRSVEQELNAIEKYNVEKILQYQKGQW